MSHRNNDVLIYNNRNERPKIMLMNELIFVNSCIIGDLSPLRTGSDAGQLWGC